MNAPWGVTLAPKSFGAAPERLLGGNFGDGRIHVFNYDDTNPQMISASADGSLEDDKGKGLTIDGLWALKFGPDAGGFHSNQLYFTAGPGDEQHGLFGRLDPLGTTSSGGSSGSGPTNGSTTGY